MADTSVQLGTGQATLPAGSAADQLLNGGAIPAASTAPAAQVTTINPIASPYDHAAITSGVADTLQSHYEAADAKATALQSATNDPNNPDSVSSQILSLMGQEGNKPADTQKEQDASGATALAKQLADLNQQAKNLNLESLAIPIQTQEKNAGTGATDAGVAPQNAGALRMNALKALSLSQQSNIAQGNYDAAKDIAQKAIDVKYAPIEAKIATLKQQYEFNKDALTAADAKRTEALNALISKQASDVADQKAAEKANADNANYWAKAAYDAGQSDVSGEISKLDPASPTFKSDLAALQSKINPDVMKQLDIQGKELANKKLQSEIDAAGGGNGIAFPQDYSSLISSRTPEQVKNFNAIPDADKASVAQLISGDALLSDLVKSRGAQGTKDINRYISEATAVDPNFSVNTNKVRYAFLKQWNDPNGKASVTKNSINTALGHLADFKASADALGSGSIQKLNSVQNILKTETGDASVLRLRADIGALASEIATIYKNGASPTQFEIDDWKNTIAADFSKAQFKGVSDELTKLLSSKITATRYQYKSTMGFEYDQSIIDPDKKQALIDAGINPEDIAKENVPAKDSSGTFEGSQGGSDAYGF